MNQIKWLRTTSMEHKALWRLKNGEKVFVKMFSSSVKSQINKIRGGLGREETCLEILGGLAVPRLIKLKPKDLPKLAGKQKIYLIAQSFAGGKNIHNLKFTLQELVGIWIFYVEQLAAFRRHGIIYTDFKCGNLMGSRIPLKVIIIDFDYAFPLIPGKKKLMCHGFTPGYQSPESTKGDIGTEASLVYECSVMLFHFLTDMDSNNLIRSPEGLNKAIKLLNEMNAPDMAKILVKCLDLNPLKRPKNYEDLLKHIKDAKLPPKVERIWKKLREPYIERLAEAGL